MEPSLALTRSLRHDTRGLTTIEYILLFCLLAVAGFALRGLGASLQTKVDCATGTIESLGGSALGHCSEEPIATPNAPRPGGTSQAGPTRTPDVSVTLASAEDVGELPSPSSPSPTTHPERQPHKLTGAEKVIGAILGVSLLYYAAKHILHLESTEEALAKVSSFGNRPAPAANPQP